MSATNTKSKSVSSVPLAVYKELAEELRLTQAQLAFYRNCYEKTNQKQQKLIAELHQLAEATQKIQAIISTYTGEEEKSNDQPENAIPQVGVAPQIVDQETAKIQIKPHWLAFIIGAVLVLSFGLGFVLVNSVASTRR
jgi:hypothetical protein